MRVTSGLRSSTSYREAVKMHSPRRSSEEDSKRLVKSCQNVVQAEIRTLRDNLTSLRRFLRGCQETINSETAKLENQCLGKIQIMENERLSLERQLRRVTDDNEYLKDISRKSAGKVASLEKDCICLQKGKAELCAKVKSLESKLSSKNELCSDLRKSLEETKMHCLSLENKLATNEAYVKEQKEVLHEMATDNKLLESGSADLKLQAAESEVYERALEGHVSELEAICSILREQHDEQQKYFLQKETVFKREAKEKQRELESENKKLSAEISQLELELKSEKLKTVKHEQHIQKKGEKLKKKEETILKLTEKLDSVSHDLQIEKATVEMLTRKNNDISQEVSRLQTKVSHSEEKISLLSAGEKKSIDRKALVEIGNTVQQYFDGNSSLAKKLETSLMASNSEKLEECERQLEYERKRRLSAEMEASNLSVELEKAKVELAIYRSSATKSFRSSSSRRKRLQNSFRHVSEPKNSPFGSCNQQYSELLSKVPTPSDTVQEPRPSISPPQVCNGLNIPSLIVNGDSAEEEASDRSEHGSHAETPEINSILSASEISAPISERASRKMEEATRNALALLNNSSSF